MNATEHPEIVLEPEVEALVFGGDTSLGEYYLTPKKWPDEHARLQTQPFSFFADLARLIGEKDRTILNFESVLMEDPQGATPLEKEYTGWDDPRELLPIFKALRVIAVNLGNNHTKDFGAACMLETRAKFTQAGFGTFGVGQNAKEAARPLKLRHGKKTLYIFGAMKFRQRYSEMLDYFASPTTAGIGLLDENLFSEITRLRHLEPEAIILVSPHWGQNYAWSKRDVFESSERILAAGADLVIAHGSHMVGECIADAAGIRILSIGNFVFNSPGRYKKYKAPPTSLVVKLPLSDELERGNIRLLLYPIVSDNRLTDFRPRPVTAKECQELYDLLTDVSDKGSEFMQRFKIATNAAGVHLTVQNQK